MTEHLSANEIEQYRRGALAPAALLAFFDHVASCTECRARVPAGEQTRTGISSMRAELAELATLESDHLSFDELAGFVDDTLDTVARENAQSHLDVCRICENEASELLAFKESNAPRFGVELRPSTQGSSRPGKVLAFAGPRSIYRKVGWTKLAAAAVIVIGIVTVWFVLTRRSTQAPQVAQTHVTMPSSTPSSPSDAPIRPVEAPGPVPIVTPITTSPTETGTLVALNDGADEVAIDRSGHLSGVNALSPEQESAVKSALRSEKIVDPAALNGLGRPGVLLGGNEPGLNFNLHGPFGNVIESTQPTLRWDPLEGATEYTVTVYDRQFEPIATSPNLTTTNWTVAPALKRGSVYSWQVTAHKGTAEIKSPRPPAAEAKFKVLDGNNAAGLQRARRANPDSHLVLGVLFARLGLLEESERELAALVRANPGSTVAQQLLGQVRDARSGKR